MVNGKDYVKTVVGLIIVNIKYKNGFVKSVVVVHYVFMKKKKEIVKIARVLISVNIMLESKYVRIVVGLHYVNII
jgi:hypothetical protein